MARLSNVTRILGVLFVCAAEAQLPHVGDINFYGLHKLRPDQILAAAHIATGDTLPASRIDIEDRIISLPDVMDAHVQSLCCDGDRATLFIGVEERGETSVEFRLAPTGTATLPPDLMTRYRKYSGAVARAEMKGSAPDAASRRDQEYFRLYAASHLLKLRAELRTGAEAEERAAAVTILASSATRKAAVDDLLFALQDSDDGVRTNAIRELTAIAVAARGQPALGIRIPPAGLVDLVNSVVLSDRVESTKALLALTEPRNAAAIDLIRERALGSLAEMARWQTRSYAFPPFQLLGRVAGLKDADVSESWQHGAPEQVIQQAFDSVAKAPVQ